MKKTSLNIKNEPFARRIALLGYAALLGLLFFSILFYQERTLFTDIAFQTFLIINNGGFQVMVNRFGAALAQILPVLAFHLKAPLWSILLCYSISFPLLFLFFYWLIVRVLGNLHLGWALVFLFTLIVYDGFYWPSSEQQQGLAFLLVFFAFVLRFPDLRQWWQMLLAVVGVTTIVFYHPLVFIPFIFLWGYFGGLKKELWHGRYLVLILSLVFVLVLETEICGKLVRQW